MLQRPLHGRGHLAEVVGRDVGRHTHGDACGAVDQQIREPAGQNDGFLLLAVVIGLEVDRVLGDVADHLHGQGRHLALGVAHGRGLVVARRTEVALPRDQRITHHPGLCQAHEGVVDRAVTVRVVLTHHLPDDPGALVPSPVGPVPAVVHAVQDPPMHRLEAVPNVRQRPTDDHAHRVIEVGLLDLVLQVHRLPPVSNLRARQMSRKRTSFAFRWMKTRRCSTSSPSRSRTSRQPAPHRPMSPAAESGCQDPSWYPTADRDSSHPGPCSAGSRSPWATACLAPTRSSASRSASVYASSAGAPAQLILNNGG